MFGKWQEREERRDRGIYIYIYIYICIYIYIRERQWAIERESYCGKTISNNILCAYLVCEQHKYRSFEGNMWYWNIHGRIKWEKNNHSLKLDFVSYTRKGLLSPVCQPGPQSPLTALHFTAHNDSSPHSLRWNHCLMSRISSVVHYFFS